ncbi:MAG: phosphomannomutase/phosphoglucomutase [Pseudomonadota bacterium]|nr:phosphomannomutase/phosphoglucomutase [Pseudomonadota bacterium]
MTTYSVTKSLKKEIFRAYDIRGVVNDGIDANTVYTIGKALATKIKSGGRNKVIIGRDGRLSSPHLSDALIAGFITSGCDVIFIGEVPSPILYFATFNLGIEDAVMLTGSHNPKNYNGLKMIVGGKTLSESDIKNIYDLILNTDFTATKEGVKTDIEIIDSYIDDVCQRVNLNRPLKVVLDCGNGVASNVAPKLFENLGCEVVKLYCNVDGNFPNHHPNPSVAENLVDLIDAVREYNADVGLAFDGDADRIGVVDNSGKIIWPDRLMMAYSNDILQRSPGEKIVFDVKCSSLLESVIASNGGLPIQWRTGHSVLKAKMISEQAALAGEMSGHIFFKENWYGFDDGVYSGARLLKILSATTQSCAAFFDSFPEGINTPEIIIPIAENKKFVFMKELVSKADFKDASVNTIDGLRVTFKYGWGLVRASNTTPALTLRFEANSAENLTKVQNIMCKYMHDVDPSLDLSSLLACEEQINA